MSGCFQQQILRTEVGPYNQDYATNQHSYHTEILPLKFFLEK